MMYTHKQYTTITKNHKGPMHILLLTTEYPPHQGGIASHVYELARAFAHSCGATVSVFAPHADPSDFAPFMDDKITVYRPKWRLTGKPFYDWSLHKWLQKFIADNANINPVSVVHVHGLKPLGATANLPVPVVFTNHSSGFLQKLHGSRRTQIKVKRQMTHVACLLAPSQELVNASHTLGYTGPSHFVANGVDPAKFCRPKNTENRTALRTKWGVNKNQVAVLLARRLHEKNGVKYLAESAQYLLNTNIVFIIAGQGDERPQMERLFAKANMAHRVVWLGGIPNHEMPHIYNACDISVLPSLMEATSITGLESMSCHLPIVGTRVGGLPHLVDDGTSGILVPPRDAQTLSHALRILATDTKKRLAMGRESRHRVETLFSWSKIAQQTLTIFKNL